MANANLAPGGGFLLTPVGMETIFTPEDFTDAQRQMYVTTYKYVHDQVLPLAKELEADPHRAKPTWKVVELLKKAGELGLLMNDIPEEYGGLGETKASSMIIAEGVSQYGGFSVTLGAHTGIGTLPIVWFGNAAQKQKYLPKLATAELVAAYALTEPGSGSDALAAKTKAVLSEDGKHYILNGSKLWITNGGFADIFVVFAKIDGEKFTGFLVERGTPGFTVGPEEHKMGIRGSSTCPLMFDNCKIPVENVLGEIGKGHRIAFNILNVGRFKLGAGVIGGCKFAVKETVRYAKERKAFGSPIATFPILRRKFATMAAKIFAAESLNYRLAGLLDGRIAGLDKAAKDYDRQVIAAIEEYSIECSISKVFGSETLDYVIDECLQIHGGYGYTQDFVIERSYRDARINRIFEGTNEINRMVAIGTVLKRASQGTFDLFSALGALQGELENPAQIPVKAAGGPLGVTKRNIDLMKRQMLFSSNLALQKHMAQIEQQQELLEDMADMLIGIFAADSAAARAQQALGKKHENAALWEKLADYYTCEAYEIVNRKARELICHVVEPDAIPGALAHLGKFHVPDTTDRVALGRDIARMVVDEREGYPLYG